MTSKKHTYLGLAVPPLFLLLSPYSLLCCLFLLGLTTSVTGGVSGGGCGGHLLGFRSAVADWRWKSGA